MEAIQRIWQEHRRFILQVGGGFAVFLILNSCVVDGLIGNGADRVRRENTKLESEILSLRKNVVARAPEEKKAVEELESIEKALVGRFQTPRAADIPDPSRGAPQIQFNDRIGRIWTEVQAKARERNVKIPEKITTNDLGVSQGDTRKDLERSAGYLELLGRALLKSVELGMVQVEKPVVHVQEEERVIPGDDEHRAVYRMVGLTLHGPYDAFKRLFREFQNPPFVQARIVSLDGKGVNGAIRGQVEFVGIFLDAPQDAAPASAEEAPASAKEEKPGKAAGNVRKPPRRAGAGRTAK